MLIQTFYTILNSEFANDTIRGTLRINRAHPIFAGHFPEVPVVPGVCMIQMVKELTETHVQDDLMLVAGDNIKFLAVLNPEQHPEVDVIITLEKNINLTVTATLFAGEITFLKLKAVLEKLT